MKYIPNISPWLAYSETINIMSLDSITWENKEKKKLKSGINIVFAYAKYYGYVASHDVTSTLLA